MDVEEARAKLNDLSVDQVNNRICECLILAEFDIDRGSVLREQYPPSSVDAKDEHFIADQMLPDGAHNRMEDWTLFFMNRELKAENGAVAPDELEEKEATSPLDLKPKLQAIAYKFSPASKEWHRLSTTGDLDVITCIEPALPPSSQDSNNSYNNNDSATTMDRSGSSYEKVGEITISNSTGNLLATITMSPAMGYTVLEADVEGTGCVFVSFTDVTTFGVLFGSSGDEETFACWLKHYAPSNVTEDTKTTTIPPPTSLKEDAAALLRNKKSGAEGNNAANGSSRRGGGHHQDDSAHDADHQQDPDEKSAEGEQATSTTTVSKPLFYCINCLKTKKDSQMRRGAQVKALALCSTKPFFFAFKPLLRQALDLLFDRDPEEILKRLYEVINSIDISSISKISDLKAKVWRWCIVDNKALNYHVKVNFENKLTDIPIPLGLQPEEIGDERVSVIKLVQKFKEQTMTLYNAILCEKRVVFLGYNQSAGDVCAYTLSAVMLVAPPLRGMIARRVFPYASLVNLQFLNEPGFIAGVTNPMFEHRSAWWDVLCDLDTGKIKKNPNTYNLDESAFASFDQKFIANIMSMISSHVTKGVGSSYSEDIIRSHFQAYTRDLVQLNFDDAEFADEESKALALDANATRLAHWKSTRSYALFKEDRSREIANRATKNFNVERHLRRLQVCKNLDEDEILGIFQDFIRHVRSEDQLLEFLSFLPEAQGGLYPLAVVLFHPSEAVRLAAVALFRRLDTIKEGSRCISLLNTFLMLTYERNSRCLPNTDEQ